MLLPSQCDERHTEVLYFDVGLKISPDSMIFEHCMYSRSRNRHQFVFANQYIKLVPHPAKKLMI